MTDQQSDMNRGDILIVDDMVDNLRLMSTMLTDQGYQVRCVINGQMALTVVRAAPPDLILLDINMPQMNGYEVCRQLKADDLTNRIPVIFVSAVDEVLDRVKAFEVGGIDYITKPFHLEELLARVRNQLSIGNLLKMFQEQNEFLAKEILDRRRAEKELRKANDQLARLNEELARLVSLDGLTQVANRRHFDTYLDQEWRRLAREQLPLTIIMGDVDYFKAYNDTYGHLAGDDCLRKVAQTLAQTVKRAADLVARYGGEEFVVMLPNTDVEGGLQVAEAMRQAVEHLNIPHTESDHAGIVTISFGLATTTPDIIYSANVLISQADKALYQAKARGRNQVCLVSELDVSGSKDSGVNNENTDL